MPFYQRLRGLHGRFIKLLDTWFRLQPPGTQAATGSERSGGNAISAWPRLKSFLRMLDESSFDFGPLKAMIRALGEGIETYEKAANNRKEYNKLRNELEHIFRNLEQFLSETNSLAITTSMESLCKSICKELEDIQEKRNRRVERYLETMEDSDAIMAGYQRIQTYLQRLLLNVNLSTWKIVDEQATNALLDRLCASMSACYNSSQAEELERGGCTPGTRIEVLRWMHNWVTDTAMGPVYWLNGMAGTGKTTIAYTLCAELDAGAKLGASFFCSRSLPECRDVKLIIPSIAYQLANFSRPFRSELSRVLEKERDVHTRLIQIQFDYLLIKPLTAIQNTLPDNLVVVIDALDECDNQQSTRRILDALFKMTPNLPIKFLISSRPEPEIRDQMQKQGDLRATSQVVLHELGEDMVQGDINRYLREALAPIHPTEQQITTLVQRAGILFIYAATVVRYIGYNNFQQHPRARLETILSLSTPDGSNPYQEVDKLYTEILDAAIGDQRLSDTERDDITQVLSTCVCAREPLTISALSGLLGLNDIDRVKAALRPLWSVLHVVGISGLVTTLHSSFPDYMFDRGRSGVYHCDSIGYDRTLAQCCFDCIKLTKPGFNVCCLESSYRVDAEISDLSTRVDEAISPGLFYACRYWASHLKRTEGSPEVIGRVQDFLSMRLLLWMEVMNLKQCMHNAVGVIQQAEEWVKSQNCQDELMQLVHDSWRFVAAFTSSPVSQSTPHIYVSMLPFWPEYSPIAKHYAKNLRATVATQGVAITQRRLELLAIWSVDGGVSEAAWSSDGTRIALAAGGNVFLLDGITGRLIMGAPKQTLHSVQSIGYSYDGTRIVSGSRDGTIHVCSTESEKQMAGPLRLKGHKKGVNSVSFSPDGTRVVSGSSDQNVYVWDVRIGKPMLGPLQGHTNSVRSVGFSPDGTRIISGSDDKTICVWDVHSGLMVLSPLVGHAGSVRSVSFSPDGDRIVSGSDDMTIRVWDVQSGLMMLGPLTGHTGSIRSVSFSPDGTHIASGSEDRTILLWDTQSGQTVLGPLEGHRDLVSSVDFSHDGTRIISASDDKTIRVWDVRRGGTVPRPPEGHTSWVTSAGFSPDGTRIVSGSADHTIHVWDIKKGKSILGPLSGHTGLVYSVGFSPDGTHIVSGSSDKKICVWDIRGEQAVPSTFEGHANVVLSVGFSPSGTHIVSGSADNTVRVWNRSGQTVVGPLEGHTSWVWSVAYSPDGTRVVSGSRDCTIRVWDVQSGSPMQGPFQGHTGAVRSVRFSSDGTRIVSGSDDSTIRVWDIQSGRVILGPLEGHAGSVRSVSFSPDGSQIVSASDDKTICIWDVQSSQIMLGPLNGHTGPVWSVRFSPNGTHVVSGSADNTVRVWNIKNALDTAPSSQATRSITPITAPMRTNASGWVTDNRSRLLVWVPPDFRDTLHSPIVIFDTSLIHVCLDLDDSRIGLSWDRGYQCD